MENKLEQLKIDINVLLAHEVLRKHDKLALDNVRHSNQDRLEDMKEIVYELYDKEQERIQINASDQDQSLEARIKRLFRYLEKNNLQVEVVNGEIAINDTIVDLDGQVELVGVNSYQVSEEKEIAQLIPPMMEYQIIPLTVNN